MGRFVIDCSQPGPSANYRRTKLDITVDGRTVRAGWSQSWFDLPAGPHQVQVKSRYLGRAGAVRVVIPVPAGQQATAYYRAPAPAFMPGAIGPVPQRTRGVTAAIVLITVLVGETTMVFYRAPVQRVPHGAIGPQPNQHGDDRSCRDEDPGVRDRPRGGVVDCAQLSQTGI